VEDVTCGWRFVPLYDPTATDEPDTLHFALAGITYRGGGRGIRTAIVGEPESMKSWLGACAVAEYVAGGETVLVLDCEMSRPEWNRRLHALGLDEQARADHVAYLGAPDGALDEAEATAAYRRILMARQPALVVIDSVEPFAALDTLDTNSAAGIEAFNRLYVTPPRTVGADVILIDHPVKDREQRGRHAAGSQRKLGAVDVQVLVTCKQPLTRGSRGQAHVKVAKDRYGALPAERNRAAFTVELVSDPVTGLITWNVSRIDSATDTGTTGFRPTMLMRRVSEYLSQADTPRSRNQIETEVKGNRDYIRVAIDHLTADRYLAEQPGAHGARTYRLLRPYKEPDGTTSPNLAQFRPDLAQGDVLAHLAHLAHPPYRGGEVGRAS
jgi:hypothetical protein